jgi:hypothetical protein
VGTNGRRDLTFELRLSAPDADRLRALANAAGVSRAEVVRRLVEERAAEKVLAELDERLERNRRAGRGLE